MIVISLSWPSFCVLQTSLRFFDAMIISHMISWVYFLRSSLAFFLKVCIFLGNVFVVYLRLSDDIHDSSGVLIALASTDALCWIMSAHGVYVV